MQLWLKVHLVYVSYLKLHRHSLRVYNLSTSRLHCKRGKLGNCPDINEAHKACNAVFSHLYQRDILKHIFMFLFCMAVGHEVENLLCLLLMFLYNSRRKHCPGKHKEGILHCNILEDIHLIF